MLILINLLLIHQKQRVEETNELDTINNIKENFQDTLKVLTEKLDESQKN